MCLCPLCGNYRSAVKFLNELGKIYHISELEELTPDNVTMKMCCYNTDVRHRCFCLITQNLKRCFAHTTKQKNCRECTHVCDENLSTFLQRHVYEKIHDLSDAQMKFEHYNTQDVQNPSFRPAHHPDSAVNAEIGVRWAIKYLNEDCSSK